MSRVSFKDESWLIDLAVPGTGKSHLNKANILVPLSRPSVWSRVKLLRPLWNPGDTFKKDRVIKAYMQALKPSPDFVKEMRRLRALALTTRQDWAQFLA